MADDLNPETSTRINKLCKRISVAHTLDEDIQEELRGHMEDKLLAYLNGQEAITEDDALLLTENHFGDPAAIKNLLQDVHIVETHVSLARRIVAIVAAYIVYTTAFAFSMTAVTLTAILNQINLSLELTPIYSFIVSTIAFSWTVLLYLTLRRWQRSIDSGRAPWFQRWSAMQLGATLLILIVIKLAVPTPYDTFDKDLMPLPGPAVTSVFGITLVLVTIGLQAILWLWWCDRPPRRTRTMTYATLTWLLLAFIPWHALQVVHLIYFGYDPASYTPNYGQQITLWEHDVPMVDTELEMIYMGALYFGSSHDVPYTLTAPIRADDIFASFLSCIFIIALARFFYIFTRRRLGNSDDDLPPNTV